MSELPQDENLTLYDFRRVLHTLRVLVQRRRRRHARFTAREELA